MLYRRDISFHYRFRMLAKLFTVILYLTVQQVNVDAYTDLNHSKYHK